MKCSAIPTNGLKRFVEGNKSEPERSNHEITLNLQLADVEKKYIGLIMGILYEFNFSSVSYFVVNTILYRYLGIDYVFPFTPIIIS